MSAFTPARHHRHTRSIISARGAAQLGVTTGYLTETVVADTGSTPGRIVRAAVVREAQRLLSGTGMTAAQISARLGFNEPSYFSRFFHREVGCTPTAYRTMPSRHAAVDTSAQ